jgi:hypothetical protein
MFWRRREWQLWCQMYLSAKPASQRGAWVQLESDKSRLAMICDISLGGMQLQARHRFESGALLTVEMWDKPQANLRVRVLRVAAVPGDEWAYSCTFVPDAGIDN